MFVILFESDFHRFPPYYLFSLEPSEEASQNETCQVCEGPLRCESHFQVKCLDPQLASAVLSPLFYSRTEMPPKSAFLALDSRFSFLPCSSQAVEPPE